MLEHCFDDDDDGTHASNPFTEWCNRGRSLLLLLLGSLSLIVSHPFIVDCWLIYTSIVFRFSLEFYVALTPHHDLLLFFFQTIDPCMINVEALQTKHAQEQIGLKDGEHVY